MKEFFVRVWKYKPNSGEKECTCHHFIEEAEMYKFLQNLDIKTVCIYTAECVLDWS